jgi:hypothetical protein
MHRRPLGGARRLALIGAVVAVIGSLLPWYTLGGDGGLPPLVYRAFDGTGILAFLAGLATLALIALPYAMEGRPTAIDRGLAFGILAAAAWIGLVLWIPNVLDSPEGLLPDRAYGFWITVVGAVVLARAAYDIALEPPRR